MGTENLYQRLGGRGAIGAVVDEFYDRVLADDRINHHFEDADVSDLREHQKLFVESVAGGPAEYDGRGMAAAHADLDVTEEDFAVVVEHLSASLSEHDVAQEDLQALLSEVATLKPAIVSA